MAQQHQQPQATQISRNSPPTDAQHQQQVPVAPAEAQTDHSSQDLQHPQSMPDMQASSKATQRYTHLYQQRLLRLRQDMATRLQPQYGPPTQYPPDIAQEYTTGLENAAKGFVQDIMRRDRAEMAAAQQRQAEGTPAEAAQQQQHDSM
ncbi:hypothetical protein BJX66DRAFT_343141 [Aspergillus keveii]|uniref:Uncharacterized protein n=1 Tax=Aspergillus keveii TaxID=714993 RepID=A0ABR4FQ56_9EURO